MDLSLPGRLHSAVLRIAPPLLVDVLGWSRRLSTFVSVVDEDGWAKLTAFLDSAEADAMVLRSPDAPQLKVRLDGPAPACSSFGGLAAAALDTAAALVLQ